MTSGVEGVAFNYLAPSYLEAMHGLCRDCHEKEAQAQSRPELALCSTCHTRQPDDTLNIQAFSIEQEGGTK